MDVGFLNKIVKKNMGNAYSLGRNIGSGGFGAVYILLGGEEELVVKVISVQNEHEPIYEPGISEKVKNARRRAYQRRVENIRKEIAILERLSGQKGITQMLTSFEACSQKYGEPDLFFLVQKKYVCLSEYILDHEMTEEIVLQMAKDICNILIVLDQKKILHRDIKPENLFVQWGNGRLECILGDFGVAREGTLNSGAITRIENFGFVAPEIEHGEKRMARNSDIYSLGATLFYLLSGKKVKDYQAARKQIPSLPISRDFERIILKSVSWECENRYNDAREMLYELQNMSKVKTNSCSAYKTNTMQEVADVQNHTVRKTEVYKQHKIYNYVWIAGVVIILAIIGWMTSQTSKNAEKSNGDSLKKEDIISDISDVEESEEISKEKVFINIPDKEKKVQEIAPIEVKSATASSVEFIRHSGNLTQQNQKDEYKYTVLNDGRLHIEMTELKSDTVVVLNVFNALGENVASNSYCKNGGNVTLKSLKAGDMYTIQVRQRKNYSNYTMVIGQEKPSIDVSNLTEIRDSIEHTDQRNVYSFTVPIDGRYRLDLSEVQSNTVFELYVFNSLGESVASNSYCKNNEGLTLKNLVAGEKYNVQIRQRKGYSSYVMLIGHQKPTIDISELTELKDSIEYTDQRNVYSFTVPIDGRYRLDLSEVQSDTMFELYVFNSLGETVGSDSYCKNDGGLTLKNLVAGEEYNIQVRQHKGYSSYVMLIGHQKPIVDISQYTEIYDNITYMEQQNVYLFTATETRNYRIGISGLLDACRIELLVIDSLDYVLDSNSKCENDDYLDISLEAGKTYEIQVKQNQGYGEYTLSVE